jgi:dienelactone hydrolase
VAWPRPSGLSPHIRQRNRVMADLAYILLTVAIFALFGLVVKAVERL